MKYLMKVVVVAMLAGIALLSCTQTKEERIVAVKAEDFAFVVADSIPSGWNTFEFENTGHTEHFFLLNLLPDSIPYDRYVAEVTEPFQWVMDSLAGGRTREEAVNQLVDILPSWYFTEVKQAGGVGIVSMGETARVTLNLEPGTYAMECYIKEQGVFHTTLGMISKVVVTDEPSDTEPPRANLDITLSNFTIETEGILYKGKNTCAVHFKEHPEAGLGNDVQIAKLTDESNLDSIIHWLDWMNVTGLQSPAPVRFFGGAQEAPVGSTAYFTVTLDTGNYVWIAESSAARGMVKEFTIE